MTLTQGHLSALKVNKYLMVVSGPLKENDKDTLFKVHNKYNRNKSHVGESHVELFCCHNINKSLITQYDLTDDTNVILFKNGLYVNSRSAGFDQHLFANKNDMDRMIQTSFDILL